MDRGRATGGPGNRAREGTDNKAFLSTLDLINIPTLVKYKLEVGTGGVSDHPKQLLIKILRLILIMRIQHLLDE